MAQSTVVPTFRERAFGMSKDREIEVELSKIRSLCAFFDVEIARLRREETQTVTEIANLLSMGRNIEARERCLGLVMIQRDLADYNRRLVNASQLHTRLRKSAASKVEAELVAKANALQQDLAVHKDVLDAKQNAKELGESGKLLDVAGQHLASAVKAEDVTEAQIDAVFELAQRMAAANSKSPLGFRLRVDNAIDFSDIDRRIKALQAPWSTNASTT